MAALTVFFYFTPLTTLIGVECGSATDKSGQGCHNACFCPEQDSVCLAPAPTGHYVPCAVGIVNEFDRVPLGCSACTCTKLPATRVIKAVPRLVFPSIPRSGSGWMRMMLELATGIPTQTVFMNERAPGLEPQGYVKVVVDPQTGLGRPICGMVGDCQRVRSEDRTGSEIVVVKSHSPFLQSPGPFRAPPWAMSATLPFSDTCLYVYTWNHSDVGGGAFRLLPIRNPLDNWDAWKRYASFHQNSAAHTTTGTFTEFLGRWKAHHSFWLRGHPGLDTPYLAYRFEDLHGQRHTILEAVLRRSGLWQERTLSIADVELGVKGTSSTHAKVTPHRHHTAAQNCHISHHGEGNNTQACVNSKSTDEYELLASGHLRFLKTDILFALKEARDILDIFGYTELYTLWLRVHTDGGKPGSDALKALMQRWRETPKLVGNGVREPGGCGVPGRPVLNS